MQKNQQRIGKVKEMAQFWIEYQNRSDKMATSKKKQKEEHYAKEKLSDTVNCCTYGSCDYRLWRFIRQSCCTRGREYRGSGGFRRGEDRRRDGSCI